MTVYDPTADQVVTLGAHKIKQEHVPGEWLHAAFVSAYLCANKRFEILVTDNPPPGCDRDGALETGWARTTEDVCFHGRQSTRDENRHQDFLNEIAETIKEIALPTILQLATSDATSSIPILGPLPALDTANTHSPSETIRLQLVTRGGVLQVIPGHYSGAPKST